MQPIIVAAPHLQLPDVPAPTSPSEIGDLLRHLVDLNREQVGLLRHLVAVHDGGAAKWKAFLGRWQSEFPDAGADCKAVLPSVERAFLTAVKDVTDRLAETNAEDLENDFALGEFLDRHSNRLSQLAGIINHLTPLSDNALPPAEKPAT
jgi:hypothetical protein